MKSLAMERQFGSGGREIGMKLARAAGIPCYDGELLRKAAQAQGVSVGMLEDYDEKRTGSLLYDIAAYHDTLQNRDGRDVYALFDGVKKTMEQLQRSGPAVFIGRCCTQILKAEPNVCRVFVYSSDPADRIRRTVKTEGVSEKDALRLMEKKDRQRRNYFRFWTQQEWADRNNYDLELNTSMLSTDACVEILLAAMGG